MRKVSNGRVNIKAVVIFSILYLLTLLIYGYQVTIALPGIKKQFNTELSTINLTLEQLQKELNQLKVKKSKTVVTNVKLTIVGNPGEKSN